jgi:hypothetical protein
MEIRNKKFTLAENRNLCLFGVFKNAQKNQPFINKYEKIIIPDPISIAKVEILANTSPINVAIKLLNPVIMHTVASDLNINDKDDIFSFRDIKTYLQSNLCNMFELSEMYPLNAPDTVIYMKNILFFRNEQLQIVRDPKYISVINVSPINTPKIVNEHMEVNDFRITTRIIENFFLTAYATGHKSIILTNFGCNSIDKNPMEDIAFIYNYCIIKYGHLFDNIIIAFELIEKDNLQLVRIFQNKISNFKFDTEEENDKSDED